MTNLQRSIISLSTGQDFVIVHNLHWYGIDIKDAVEQWVNERTEYNSKDLCKFIRSKNKKFLAMTGIEFQEFKERRSEKKQQ